jgi:hypothetical protein
MIVATFGAASPHVGKQVAYENGQFLVDGLPLTFEQVFTFDTRDELVWSNDGLQLWLSQLVQHQAAAAASTETATTLVAQEPAPAPSEPSTVLTSSPPEKKSHTSRNVVVGAVAFVVVVAIVFGLVASRGGKTTATSTKPKTWVYVTSVAVADPLSSKQTSIVRSGPVTLVGGDTKLQYTVSGFAPRIYIYVVPEGQTWKSVPAVSTDKSGVTTEAASNPGAYYLEVHEGFPWTAKYTVTLMEKR